MSEASLPDDIREWPANPHELFGIGPQAGMRELRRAYAALIRRFKPEHSPQQFRRIRDAYEALEWQARWRDRAELAGAPSIAAADSQEVLPRSPDGPVRMGEPAEYAASGAPPSITEPDSSSPTLRPQADENLDRVWSLAIRQGGDWQAVYRQLSLAAERGSTDETLFCRLYWLLTVAPHVDAARQPVDWLATGMARNTATPRLLSLYDQELRRRPEEAGRERSRALLAQTRPIWQLSELARHRWRALRSLCRLEEIATDHRLLSGAFISAGTEWVLLLMNAVEVLIWSSGDVIEKLLKDCLQEIEATADVQLGFAESLDRHELLLALAQEYHRSRNKYSDASGFPKGLVQLVPELWLNSDAGQFRLLEILGSWVDHPDIALDSLDVLNESCRATLAYLTTLLTSLAPREREEPQGARLSAIIALIESHDWDYYRANRKHLFHDCLRMGIWVNEILHVLHDTPKFADLAAGTAATELHGDLPLKCLLAGHLAFWR